MSIPDIEFQGLQRSNDCIGVQYDTVLDFLFVEGSNDPVEPVTLDEAKDFCAIELDYTQNDPLIEMIITAAREKCEAFTGLSFIPREIQAVINNSNGAMYLPYGPVGEVISMADSNDDDIDSDHYRIAGVQWKQVIYPRDKRLTVIYDAGYSVLPAVLKLGLLNAIYYMYDNRSIGVDTIGPIAEQQLKPYRRV